MKVALLFLVLSFLTACVSSPRVSFEDVPGDKSGLIRVTEHALSGGDRYYLYIALSDSVAGPFWQPFNPETRIFVDDQVCMSVAGFVDQCTEKASFSRIYSKIDGKELFEDFSEESLARAKEANRGRRAFFAVETTKPLLKPVYTLSMLQELTDEEFCGVIQQNGVPEAKCLSFSKVDHFSLADTKPARNAFADAATTIYRVSATSGLIAIFGARALMESVE